MRHKHAKSRQPGVIRRLRARFDLAEQNRHLSEALEAVIKAAGQQEIAVAAIRGDGYAEGLAAGLGVGWAPVRGGLAGRHLTAVPSIRSTGT